MSAMFSSFTSVGLVSDGWKTAIVTPVYNSALTSDVSNYRPISLTCVACQVMQRIVVSNLRTSVPTILSYANNMTFSVAGQQPQIL